MPKYLYKEDIFIMSLKLKCTLFYFDMLITFCFEVSSNLSQQKSPTAELYNIGKAYILSEQFFLAVIKNKRESGQHVKAN